MRQRIRMPARAAWLVTVAAMWPVTTALLAVMIRTTDAQLSAGALAADAMQSAAFACVVVGGPAAAVSLRVRRTCGRGRAVLTGLATAALILLFLYSYLEASGGSLPGVWDAVGPVFVVALAETALAVTLRGRRTAPAAAGPDPAAAGPDQPAAGPDPAAAAAGPDPAGGASQGADQGAG